MSNDWLVNDRTVCVLTVDYSKGLKSRADPSINVGGLDEAAKKAHDQQVAMEIYEHENYPRSLAALAMGSQGPDASKDSADIPATDKKVKGTSKDMLATKKNKKAAQEAYDQAVTAAFRAGYEAGRKRVEAVGPSEMSRSSAATAKSWQMADDDVDA